MSPPTTEIPVSQNCPRVMVRIFRSARVKPPCIRIPGDSQGSHELTSIGDGRAVVFNGLDPALLLEAGVVSPVTENQVIERLVMARSSVLGVKSPEGWL